jgi:GH24 family phage-related lysozyme (muramidase)
MADPIQLLSAARAHKDLSHQISAWRQLQQRLSTNDPAALAEFAELFRADPPAKPQASPTPGVDWLAPCLVIVKEFEGCKLTAYPDPGTGGEPWTIGWGATGSGIRPGTKWTQQQADARLVADLRQFHHGVLTVLPMAVEWSGNRQAALVSFAYNVGIGALQESTLRKRLIQGDDPALVVREELPRWNKGGSGVLPGLVRRRAAEVALFVGGQHQEPQPGRVRPGDPFSTRLSAHFTLGEFALGQEARRFTAQHQVDTAAELAAFLERVRSRFGKPVILTSGYRPPAINRSVGGASQSEHLYAAPGVGAVDFYVDGASIKVVQDWCDKEWPYSVGYGAPKGFVHLGIRKGRPRIRWDY